MKHSILFACLCCAGFNTAAQSSVTISGWMQAAATYGNGGTTPIDGLSANNWALNDQSSVIDIAGYQYSLSKRTNLFANISSAKGKTATATNTTELGFYHSF